MARPRSWIGAGCAFAAASLALGCGGGQPAASAPTLGAAEAAPPAAGDDVVPADKIDEIRKSLDRKRPVVARCLASAIDNQELPRSASGKITLDIVISPAGKAESVKVTRSTLASKQLESCVIGRVQDIAFPELPRVFETSYTYGFEAM
jgi:hypothetical protein